MRYNFGTKKGYITDVITQQGEGYVTAGRTKKMDLVFDIAFPVKICPVASRHHDRIGRLITDRSI